MQNLHRPLPVMTHHPAMHLKLNLHKSGVLSLLLVVGLVAAAVVVYFVFLR